MHRKVTATLALLALATTMLAGCTDDGDAEDGGDGGTGTDDPSHCSDPDPIPAPSWPVAVLETTLGTIEAELYLEMVPRTAGNFICLAQAGFYDGTRFHRIISDFMMQGGDPNSKDGDPGNDGQGDPGYEVPDEFHRLLRHDQAGVLSMANSGPNSGGSQFFITFGPTPHLDDKHAVFGQVKQDSMAVLEKVNAEAASGSGAPATEVELRKVTIRFEERVTTPAFSFDLWSPDPLHRVPADGGTTRFLVVVESGANQRMDIQIGADGHGNVTTGVEAAFTTFQIPAYQRQAFVVDVAVPGDASNTTSVAVTAGTGDDPPAATLDLTVQRSGGVGPERPTAQDTVRVDYIGMTADGRIFDTSVESVGQYAVENDLGWGNAAQGGFNGRPQYEALEIGVGQVVPGFSALLMETPVGGDNAARLSPEQGYGSNGSCSRDRPYCLIGRTLFFDIEDVQVIQEGQ